MQDYAIAYQLMNDAFLEGIGQKERYTDRRLELVCKEGIITAKRISEVTGVSGSAISQWLKPLISKGVLIWCDEHGVQFPDEESLEKAKRSGNAYVKINGTLGLPSVYDLTGDKKWSPDGELYREHDLGLDDEVDEKYFEGANDEEVSLGIEDDPDKIIDFSRMNQPGVKVLSGNNGHQNKNISDNGHGSAKNSGYSTDRLNDDLSGILSFN
jgi:hypothetical protein